MSKEQFKNKDVVLSPAKVYRLVKILKDYRRQLGINNKLNPDDKIPEIMSRLNREIKIVNSLLENRGVDKLIDTYTKKLQQSVFENVELKEKAK